MRSLPEVIDKITAAAPDLEPHLRAVRQSAIYAASEVQPLLWRRAGQILTEHAGDHPKADELRAIFSGTDQTEKE